MVIDQIIDGRHVRFTRNWFTGRASISADGFEVLLQDPLDLGTHFWPELERSWTCRVGRHMLEIEKVKPLLFVGMLPQTYRFYIDGVLVTERSGF